MDASTTRTPAAVRIAESPPRLDYLDATRAFALVLGVFFHAGLSFVPIYIGWAVQDVSTSRMVGAFLLVSHSFRMETFFLLAGFFSHLVLQRRGIAAFVRSRLLRILVPFIVGWFILRPLITSGWIMGSASLSGDVDVMAGLVGGFQSLGSLPDGIFTGTHLWFLYYLMLITALVLAGRGFLNATGSWKAAFLRHADALVAWLADCPASPVLLAVPTAAALWFMSSWGMDTPDKSLIPHFPALAVYGGFFVLGWMLNRQSGLITRFARLTAARWLMAAAGIVAVILLSGMERNPGHSLHFAARVTHAFGYALTMWSLVFLTIGVFRKICVSPNAVVRFIADSSYWMYLVHLPVVVWLQVAVAELPFHWSLKLPMVSLMTIAISLLSYDLFVRSTFIGKVLNGRKRERVLPALFRGLVRHFRSGTNGI